MRFVLFIDTEYSLNIMSYAAERIGGQGYTAEQIVDETHKLEERLEVPKYSLVLVGGAALTLWDLKQSTDDIDASVSLKVLRKVIELPSVPRIWDDGRELQTYYPCWDIGNGWGNMTHRQVRSLAVYRAGVAVLPPAPVLQWKADCGRPKDARDLLNVIEHLASLEGTNRGRRSGALLMACGFPSLRRSTFKV